MAQALNIPTSEFTNQYCKKTDGIYHLIDGDDGECQFLKSGRCDIYEGRPTQCRTWPFWPETMSPKAWKTEVAEIQRQIEEQQDCEEQLGT